MFQKFATCYSTVSNMKRYRQQLHNIIIILFPFSLSSSQISLSPSSHLYLLYSSSIARRSPMATTQCCRSHQRPPLDATNHLSSLFCFRFFFFFFFPFSFSVHIFWLWFDGWVGQWVSSDGQIDGGWVRVMGYGSGEFTFMGCGLWRWVGWVS